MPPLRSKIAVEEVGVPNRTCGNITDAQETDTTTAGPGVTAESKVAGPTAMIDIAVVTGVHVRAKGICPTPPTPKINKYSSAVKRPTVTEVIQDECW